MELLERYLKQIERYLPFKERQETTKELRSLILDQVDESVANGLATDIALYNVIVEMGDPRDVANSYFERKPLISRALEPTLKLVLKIISITLPLALTFANMLEYVLNNDNTTLMDNLLNVIYTIPSTLYSLLFGYGIVFAIFLLIERFIHPNYDIEGTNSLIQEKEFNPNLLPKIPTKHFKVSLFESIFTILITTLVVYLFNMQPGLVAIKFEGSTELLFNSNFERILVFINIGWFITIGLNIYYLFKRRKNIGSKTVELIHTIYSGVMLIVIGSVKIFNEVIIDGYGLNLVPTILKVVFIFLGIAVIIGGIVEYVLTYVNLEALDEVQKRKSPKV